jgi:hypothetical protein
MQYLLLFYGKNCYASTSQRQLIRTLPILFIHLINIPYLSPRRQRRNIQQGSKYFVTFIMMTDMMVTCVAKV